MMADKYQVAALLRLCENYLAEQLVATNVVPVLVLAHERGATLLKESALRFLRSQAGEVSDQHCFRDIPAELLEDIVREMAKCV